MAEIYPFIKAIYVAPDKGKPMEFADIVDVDEQRGIRGDRYAEGRGAYSQVNPGKVRDLSLIAVEDIDAANEEILAAGGEPFFDGETRRNIVTEGVYLEHLVGVEFTLGGIAVRGDAICDECKRPTNLSKKPGFKEYFGGTRGGLRVRALGSGVLMVGTPIVVPDFAHRER